MRPAASRSPKTFSTERNDACLALAISKSISRSFAGASARGTTLWCWKNPRLPYMRFHAPMPSSGKRYFV